MKSSEAAREGRLEVLVFYREHIQMKWKNWEWYIVSMNAARGGHAHVLQWCFKNGCPCNHIHLLDLKMVAEDGQEKGVDEHSVQAVLSLLRVPGFLLQHVNFKLPANRHMRYPTL